MAAKEECAMITDAEIAEIEARAKAATDGPWEPCIGSGNCEMTALSHQEQEGDGTEFVCDLLPEWALHLSPRKAENMEFIAHARTDVPRLVAELRAAREAMRKSVKDCGLCCVEGDCGAEWEMEPKPCPNCTPLIAALPSTISNY